MARRDRVTGTADRVGALTQSFGTQRNLRVGRPQRALLHFHDGNGVGRKEFPCMDNAADPRGRGPCCSSSAIQRFLKMEQRWLFLSRSHEFAERVSRFTGNLGSVKFK